MSCMEKFNPIILILLGVIFSFVGVMIMSIGLVIEASGSISTGGVIFIGPIPIVFGSGEYGSQLIWIGLIITILMFLISYVIIRNRRALERTP